MAITILEQNTVTNSSKAAKLVLEQLKPVLDSLDTLYNAGGGVGLKDTITQGDLDSIPSFSGLTKQQLDDGMFALTGTIKSAIVAAYTALAELAARS